MQQSQYTEAVIASMTLIFGEGFLSPGGQQEVQRIIQSQLGHHDLAGRKIIDWGCGLGGTAMALGPGMRCRSRFSVSTSNPATLHLARELISAKQSR